jgi:phage terminase large subunit GpA-like protein
MTRLLRPNVRCPRCGTRPRFRISEAERELSLQQPPDALKQTQQCHHCGEIYAITAANYQTAA